MRRRIFHALLGGLAIALIAAGCNAQPGAHDAKNAAPAASTIAPEVSGKLEGGLRVVTLDPATPAPVIRVYRGDYIRMELTSGAPFTVTIDSLKLSWSWPVPEGGKPYLKMAESGRFPFQAGSLAGTLEVIDFQAAAYREVGAVEAAQIVANLKPFVLDVRTTGEFAEGHLEGAMLLPIQELQQRLGELAAHKHDPVFIYCHSGNRSTVASKLLVDAGFDQVINLRKGINDWKAAGLPLVR